MLPKLLFLDRDGRTFVHVIISYTDINYIPYGYIVGAYKTIISDQIIYFLVMKENYYTSPLYVRDENDKIYKGIFVNNIDHLKKNSYKNIK